MRPSKSFPAAEEGILARLMNTWPTLVLASRFLYATIPCRRDKRPAIPSWKQFQTTLPTIEQIADWAAAAPDAVRG